MEIKEDLSDKIERIDLRLNEIHKRLNVVPSDSYEQQELIGEQKDLKIMRGAAERALPQAASKPLSEREAMVLSHFAEDSYRNHRKAIEMFEGQGDFRNVRLYSLQALGVMALARQQLNL